MSGFQQAFAHALLQADAHGGVLAELAAQPGFAVYSNTAAQACIDALAANFPTVLRLVGVDWFRSVAAAYARAHPPRDSRLLFYGDDGFPAFLQAVPTAAGLPWLAGVARLDASWRGCHAAADARVLDAASLSALPPEALAARKLRPHPATRWAWFDGQPVADIWCSNREQDAAPAPDRQDGGLLLTRPGDAVRWAPLAQAGCAFLDACAEGRTLGEAAQCCLDAHPGTDLAALLQQLLQAGTFTADPPPWS